MPDITESFSNWLSEGGLLELDPQAGIYTVNLSTPQVDLSRKTVWHLNGHGSRIWFPYADKIEFDNPDTGPANQDKVRISNASIEGAGLSFLQPNMVKVTDVRVKGAKTGLEVMNVLPEGQAEHNEFDMRIINCVRGVHCHKYPAAWGSMKGSRFRTLVSGAKYPYLFHRMSPYGGTLELSAFAGSVVARDAAVFCFRETALHGTHLDLHVEGEAHIGLYIDDYRTQWTDSSLTSQATVNMSTIHRLNHVAIYNGPKAELPDWKFTHGDPHNGNAARPQWETTDGHVT